ncbi:autotransporter domain-containing SGNH/GDSL hydrolase family protein [Azotobacter salinestris]|uniref:autotransporter domain-containing SGNH/GDSL hydrolase family protein n=1 Tax=Azotobacter salinestris TaxID=69964 RepID=UPI001266BE6C|nr:autotransporter domain-containing SGNH/GDSL hydrolase family protein [Azotobacter salinestris]
MPGILRPLAVALLLALPRLAPGGPYSQLVVFGDSLSDGGQFPDAGGPLWGGLPTGGLRFTNRTGPGYLPDNSEYFAPVAVQRLAGRLGLAALPSTPILPQVLTGNPDGSNYAVGGYLTGQVRASIMDPDGSVVNAGGGLARTRDGYLVETPQVDPNALFYVNGGGNDIFQGRIVDPASATQAAAELVEGVAALQRAGARYIIVADLPDVGATPAGLVSGARPLWSQAAPQFDAALDTQLAGLGGNLIRLNLRGLLAEVRADPATFGLDPGVAQSDVCFDGSRGDCREDPTWGLHGGSPDPRRLLFNDGVHPTATVQQISADYTHALLVAPWEITLLPDMGRAALRAHLRLLDGELQAQQGRRQVSGTWRFAVQGGYRRPDYDGGNSGAAGNGRSRDLALVASRQLAPQWLAGLSLGVADNHLELGEADSDYEMSSVLLTGFARYQRSRLFVDLRASLGWLDYHDLERRFALGNARRTEEGDSEGWLWGVGGRLGLNLFEVGARLRAGPFVGADYQRVTVDAYREHGNSASALAYDEQKLESLLFVAGLFFDCALNENTRLLGEIAREHEDRDEAEDLRLGLVSVPGNRFRLRGYIPPDKQTRLALGLTRQFGEGLTLRASYHYLGGEDSVQGVDLSLTRDI